MFFINKLLLPLIKNEKTVPLCLIENKSLKAPEMNRGAST
jgi:hypothetical protein